MSLAAYDDDIYCGYILRGDLRGAIDYLNRFPECGELSDRYASLFEDEQYMSFGAAPELEELLRVYQRYYRGVFYLSLDRNECALRLRDDLSRLLGVADPRAGIGELEQGPIAEAFRQDGLHFLGGKTGGYYGPYVWKTTEIAAYDVELPGGTRRYDVKLLDGFLTKGWIDYISFGHLGTGGWTDADGCLCCVKSSYDPDSENFRVSLLKHEAQHAWDLERRPDLSPTELEYRAKLVELCYSFERPLLPRFIREAVCGDAPDGHAAAAEKIAGGFSDKLAIDRDALDGFPLPLVRETALELFWESERALFSQ